MSDPPEPTAGTTAEAEAVAGEVMTPAPERGPAADDTSTMSLVGHLSELRRRVAISILAVLVFGAVGFYLAPQIIGILLEPLPGGKVVFITLSGGFFLYMRIALIVGVVLGLPIVLYQAWAFVSPGLTPSERRAALPWIPMTILFFVLGAAVAYVTLPYAVGFLISFQIPGSLEALPTAEAYFGFVAFIFLIFGLVMQFPVVLVTLSKLGILDVAQLKAGRRYVLFGIVVFAVVITPGGDPVSPIVLSGTMYALYEATILILRRRAPAPVTQAPAADA